MTPEKLYQIVKDAPKFGKMTVIKNKAGEYCIFSTPDRDSGFRQSDFMADIEEAKNWIGEFIGEHKDIFVKNAVREGWQFHSYIDIFEFFDRSGYKKGMKVRYIPTGKVGTITDIHKWWCVIDSEYEGPYKDIEPVHEEEDTVDITVDGKTRTISRKSAEALGLID